MYREVAKQYLLAKNIPGLTEERFCSNRWDLSGLILRDLDFCSFSLAGVDFSNSDLTGAKLSHSTIWSSDFTNAILVDADLRHSDLRGSKFVGANLAGAKIEGANFDQTDLTGAEFPNISISRRNHKKPKLTAMMIVNKLRVDYRLSKPPEFRLIKSPIRFFTKLFWRAKTFFFSISTQKK